MIAVKSRRVPPGLARVRKELPPPVKVLNSKKSESRHHAREKLRREIEELPKR
jgi:hypothetical protein